MKTKIPFCLSVLILNFSFIKAQYMLYGVTSQGGVYNKGTIFSFNPLTNSQATVFSFNDTDGFNPLCTLLYASDSLLYGTTDLGGVNERGTVFSFNWKTNTENVVIYYDSINGYNNSDGNSLIQSQNGLLYGSSSSGGNNGCGVIYSYNLSTKKDSIQYNFQATNSGAHPYMSLYEDTLLRKLYGVTIVGGKLNGGVLHGFDVKTGKDTAYISFKWKSKANPWYPSSSLIRANNGLLYGMSVEGGYKDSGTIYSYDPLTDTVKMAFQFHSKYGAYPDGNGLIQLSNGLLYGTTPEAGTIYDEGVLFSFNPANDSEIVLKTFNDSDGWSPQTTLVQDPDNGLLYGLTDYRGKSGMGVLFSFDITTSTYTKLVDFTGANGAYPSSGLTLVKDTSVETGMKKINGNPDMKVYPNPNNGTFMIILRNVSEPTQIEIYNVLGENIYQTRTISNNTEINLKGQANGVYFYRVLKETGELVGSGKIIIEK